ncbi:Septin spn4 [Blastocladiella emersonii ATCC 22665]|nr:Septin spn4 [Blastocladiella emersonii ATCC 22665]
MLQSPSSTIGIANLPNQTHKIVSRKGATFTVMVVGEAGTGKSTFVNTLLTTTVKNYRDPNKRRDALNRKTVSIDVIRVEFEEKGFRTQLNVVDTPGFGDYVNNRDAWVPIIDFIDGQHESYLRQEMQPERVDMLDGRVHACLYFIYPSGQTLRPLDIETMKKLGTRVNLIPVIAKADTLTPKDLANFKRRVRDAIAHHNINVYLPPVESDTEGTTERNQVLVDAMPYSVIGSEDDVVTPDGRTVKGRQYLWGVSEVENEDHCDFKKLRNLLIRQHMLDLVTTTEENHYETFRSTHLDANGRLVSTVTRKDAKFKEEEDNLRRRFAEQVKAKEAMFRQWEQKLIAERDKLNKDLEHEHSYITALTSEIKLLEEKMSSKK